jgi:BirA family transcriptional regulator, biotin operon repressor / biotin---[acetyl-CoA-carboxylase] ligase
VPDPERLAGTTESYRFDGRSARELAGALALPDVVLYESVGSTLDEAHALAADGAPAGTLVLADRQTAGRGRSGRRWASPSGSGLWLSLVERPSDPAAVEVLSLRLGLRAARALDPFAEASVHVKWPNDLYLDGRKLAGILVEARWRAARPDWVAVGFGLNVSPPADVPAAAGLRPGSARVEVLQALIPALRDATCERGPLGPDELRAFAERDVAFGRACVAPAEGTVRGITSGGELIVETPEGSATFRGGSLVFREEA